MFILALLSGLRGLMPAMGHIGLVVWSIRKGESGLGWVAVMG